MCEKEVSNDRSYQRWSKGLWPKIDRDELCSASTRWSMRTWQKRKLLQETTISTTANILPLCVYPVSLSFSLTHSIFPLPLSTCLTHHYPCEARRQPSPGVRGRRASIMGNVTRHMSKVQPVSWKSCVWCDSSPPATSPASSTTKPDSIHPADTKASCVHPEGEREQETSQQWGSSVLFRQDKCFSSCSLTSLHSYCPQEEWKRVLCVCVSEKQSVRDKLCVCQSTAKRVKVCLLGVKVVFHSHKHLLTNLSARQTSLSTRIKPALTTVQLY